MPNAEEKLTHTELTERWQTELGQAFRKEIIHQFHKNKKVDWENLIVKDLNNKTHKWEEFKGVNEIKIQTENDPSFFSYALRDLRGISLTREKILNSCFFHTHLERANLCDSNLMGADLRNAFMQMALMYKIRLDNANLINANFEAAEIGDGIFDNANLTNAKFRMKSWWWRVKEWFWNIMLIRLLN